MTGFLFVLWTIGLAIQLNGIRLFQMAFFWPKHEEWTPVFKTLFLGFRFDLLVIGFWLVPVVLFILVRKVFTKVTLPNPWGVKLYLKLSWFFISFIYFLDLVYFTQYKEHMWWEEFSSLVFLKDTFWDGPEWWAWITLFFITWGLIRSVFWSIEKWMKRFKNFSYLSLAIIFIWTVFIARGTVTSDHLRRNDCDWAKYNTTVHAFCMNPLYVFSKNR